MIPLVLTPSEVLAALAGTLTEIRRPIEPQPDPAVVRADIVGPWCHFEDEAGPPNERGNREGRMWTERSPLGVPGDLLFGQEEWRSWQSEWDEDAGDTEDPGGAQTYVAYAATPKIGYRPIPDKARITYLHETSPLASSPELLGPWEPAETMPEWASRVRLVNRGVRVERADVWTWCVAVERAGGGL